MGGHDDLQRAKDHPFLGFVQFVRRTAHAFGHHEKIRMGCLSGDHHSKIPVADAMNTRPFQQRGAVLLRHTGRVPSLGMRGQGDFPTSPIRPHHPMTDAVKDPTGRRRHLAEHFSGRNRELGLRGRKPVFHGN